jgi:hypothetical protein
LWTTLRPAPRPRDGVGTETASQCKDHDPLTKAESINDPRRPLLPTRPELHPAVLNRLIGCLHHCLATRQHYNVRIAFPTTEPTSERPQLDT